MKLETPRLIIRNFTLEDEEDLCEYMLQRVNAEFEAYPWFTREKGKEEIQNRSKSDEFYAIELKKAHKVIGNVYFGKREFNTKELGYVPNEDYQGKGYGSEASKAVIDDAFLHGLHREAFFQKNVCFHTDAQGNPIYWDTYVYAVLNPSEA